MFHLFSLSDIKRSTLSCFCLSCGGSTHLVSLLSVQCNRLLHNFTQLTIRARASTCSIFCLSAFFSEMKAAAVQVRFCQISCSGLTSLPALLPIGAVTTCHVLPNSVLLCQSVGLVRACCPKRRVVHCLFFPLQFQILAHLLFPLTSSGAVWGHLLMPQRTHVF